MDDRMRMRRLTGTTWHIDAATIRGYDQKYTIETSGKKGKRIGGSQRKLSLKARYCKYFNYIIPYKHL